MQNRERFPTADSSSRQERRLVRARAHLKIAAGIAAAAIAVSGAVDISSNRTERAEAKTQASKTLGPIALKNLCKTEGLRGPKVMKAFMNNPGRKNNPRIQTIDVDISFEAMTSACRGKYQRSVLSSSQLESSTRRNKWHRLMWPKWKNIYYSNGEISSGMNISSNGHQGNNVFYKCTPGKRKTRARTLIRNRVIDLTDHRIVGQRTREFPVKIEGGGC